MHLVYNFTIGIVHKLLVLSIAKQFINNYPQLCFDLYMIKGTGSFVCSSLPNCMYKNFALKGSLPFCGLFFVKYVNTKQTHKRTYCTPFSVYLDTYILTKI